MKQVTYYLPEIVKAHPYISAYLAIAYSLCFFVARAVFSEIKKIPQLATVLSMAKMMVPEKKVKDIKAKLYSKKGILIMIVLYILCVPESFPVLLFQLLLLWGKRVFGTSKPKESPLPQTANTDTNGPAANTLEFEQPGD